MTNDELCTLVLNFIIIFFNIDISAFQDIIYCLWVLSVLLIAILFLQQVYILSLIINKRLLE